MLRAAPLPLALFASCSPHGAAPDGTAPFSVASAPPPRAASASASATASATASAIASADPFPTLRVSHIGMHIGGGLNDAREKEPIRRSVAPSLATFKHCLMGLGELKLPLDVSVDLRIERAGGTARVTKVASARTEPAFSRCITERFAAITFLPPVTGTTNVSYSLRYAR